MCFLLYGQSNALELFTDSPGIDLEAIKRSMTVHEFESHLSRVTSNYPTVDDDYSDSSCITRLQDVRILLLCGNETETRSPARCRRPRRCRRTRALSSASPSRIADHLSFFESGFDPDTDSHPPQLKGVEMA